MSAGYTHAFRHLDDGEPCPVLPTDRCPEPLAEHHRPRHCLPIAARVAGPAVRPQHRKRVPADSDPAPSRRWSYATTQAQAVTR